MSPTYDDFQRPLHTYRLVPTGKGVCLQVSQAGHTWDWGDAMSPDAPHEISKCLEYLASTGRASGLIHPDEADAMEALLGDVAGACIRARAAAEQAAMEEEEG